MLLLLVSATGFALHRDGAVSDIALRKIRSRHIRSVALLKFNIEKQTPNRLGFGGE
jgi:hypothetical protein